ncbi:MAG TPA: 50S ribosomal protein L21 [Candidatus Dormibacteraeota bacterium]|nr:50S ribosomal protein L21 [Candidatus Dormibacteraeota bacterium]
MPKSKAKARAEAVEVEAKANPKVKAKAKAAEAKAAKGKPAEAKGKPEAKGKGESRFAVVQARGLQLRVAKDEEHILPRLNEEPGAEIAFDRVLLVSEGDQIQVGKPLVEGAVVLMQVIGHEKGEKIDVGTYKRRKKYRRKIGYRDQLTRVKILDINLPHEEKRGKHGA